MPDAVSVSVAKAIVAELQTAKLSRTISPERSYAEWDLELKEIDKLELKDADKLRVDVVSHSTEQVVEQISRGMLEYRIPVDVAVRRKFGADKTNDDTGRIEIEEVDKLLYLVEEIHALFANREEEFNGGAKWNDTAILAAPVIEHLRDMRQFTGIIRLTFIAYREVQD